MEHETIDEYELAGGQLTCHRKHLLVLPAPLGKLSIIHQPCIREKCTLWDSHLKLCLDVVNSNTLIRIARTLNRLEDRLPPELP